MKQPSKGKTQITINPRKMFKNTTATKEMRIKTTLRIHPTPVQMAIAIKINRNKQ